MPLMMHGRVIGVQLCSRERARARAVGVLQGRGPPRTTEDLTCAPATRNKSCEVS